MRIVTLQWWMPEPARLKPGCRYVRLAKPQCEQVEKHRPSYIDKANSVATNGMSFRVSWNVEGSMPKTSPQRAPFSGDGFHRVKITAKKGKRED